MPHLITIKADTAYEDLQDNFKRHLGKKKIAEITAKALNKASGQAIKRWREGLESTYNFKTSEMPQKWVRVKPRATTKDLTVGLEFSTSNIPLIYLKPRETGWGKGGRSSGKVGYSETGGVEFTIRKGKKSFVPNAFIRRMESGHAGVWTRGEYRKGSFYTGDIKTRTGNFKITERVTLNPFFAALNIYEAAPVLQKEIQNIFFDKLQSDLQKAANKVKE